MFELAERKKLGQKSCIKNSNLFQIIQNGKKIGQLGTNKLIKNQITKSFPKWPKWRGNWS